MATGLRDTTRKLERIRFRFDYGLRRKDSEWCRSPLERSRVAPAQVLMALVKVKRLPNGSDTDISLLPHGFFSIPGRAFLYCLATSSF